MIILPAIDLVSGKAVRLFKGDYNQMTVYSDHPEEIAMDFAACGAEWIHIVDLEGAKSGTTPNIDTIEKIVKASGLKAEVGGGIRSLETIQKYADAGVSRVVLGTAAVKDPEMLKAAVKNFGSLIAVGVDIKDGYVAINGWTEKSTRTAEEFCKEMSGIGVETVICTDVSKDGAMKGTNLGLYKELNSKLDINIVASGGVSSMDDVLALKEMGMYAAIIGKAYYTGAVDLKEAIAKASE